MIAHGQAVDGSAVGVIAVGHDITESRLRADDLRLFFFACSETTSYSIVVPKIECYFCDWVHPARQCPHLQHRPARPRDGVE